MAFTKGDPRINRQGRPPSTNHLELRKTILKGIDIQELFQDLETLSPRDRVNATLKLMEFVLPKLSSVQTQESNLKDMVQDLTKTECADLIDQIIDLYGED